MKQNDLQILQMVIVTMVYSVMCTPATLCLYRNCSPVGMTCPSGAILQIRNAYRGQLSVEKFTELYQERCSGDGVFCVQAVRGSGDVYFRYANRQRYLPESARHPPQNDWCRNGVEYWLDV